MSPHFSPRPQLGEKAKEAELWETECLLGAKLLEQTLRVVKDREAWHAAVREVAKSQTRLSDRKQQQRYVIYSTPKKELSLDS